MILLYRSYFRKVALKYPYLMLRVALSSDEKCETVSLEFPRQAPNPSVACWLVVYQELKLHSAYAEVVRAVCSAIPVLRMAEVDNGQRLLRAEMA